MIRYLELQPPGARRHTHTAGTTEASLLGLLDVETHAIRVLKGFGCVNRTLLEPIRALGMRVLVDDTVMEGAQGERRLAASLLRALESADGS